jgi:hypothetical protein
MFCARDSSPAITLDLKEGADCPGLNIADGEISVFGRLVAKLGGVVKGLACAEAAKAAGRIVTLGSAD